MWPPVSHHTRRGCGAQPNPAGQLPLSPTLHASSTVLGSAPTKVTGGDRGLLLAPQTLSGPSTRQSALDLFPHPSSLPLGFLSLPASVPAYPRPTTWLVLFALNLISALHVPSSRGEGLRLFSAASEGHPLGQHGREAGISAGDLLGFGVGISLRESIGRVSAPPCPTGKDYASRDAEK